MPRAYIGLGANLNDPPAQLRAALARLAASPDLTLCGQSSFYRSTPLGPGPQPDYCNAVCCVDTTLSPDALLSRLHEVERDMGRERPPQRWAPRLIDLDLLHYEGVSLRSGRLVLPHPELHQRNFVAVPLAELAPALELPGLGPVGAIAERLGRAGLAPWT